MSGAPLVLFLCTGNYYRSRFAELLFNHLAAQQGAGFGARAESAGLARECRLRNEGPLSRHAAARLAALGVREKAPPRDPCDVTDEHLARATLIIALKESEHRPMVEERFPAADARRVRYWHVDDIEDVPPAVALVEIEGLVRSLVEELRGAARSA